MTAIKTAATTALMLLLMTTTVSCSDSTESGSPGDDTSTGADTNTVSEGDSATPTDNGPNADTDAVAPDSAHRPPSLTESEVFPYGLKYQLHENSTSVNVQPPHGSNLQQPIGNSGAGNQVTIPQIQNAEDYATQLYFDSAAPAGGDGSIAHPYNNLNMVDALEYPNDAAILLKAGSIFYEARLNAGETQQHIYFGVYGEGESPIVTNVDDLAAPTSFGSGCNFGGTDITVDGIHIVGSGGGNYERLLNIGGSDLTIAHCHLESIPHPEVGYLYNIFKGGVQNMVLYHSEVAFSRDDIWYASSNGTYQIVSNYFHHANMGTYFTDNFDPENRETWQSKGGDIIQFEYENLGGAYIANNFFDKGDSAAKFALIFNGGQSNKNVVVEYNTFIAPMNAFGGAALQWHTAGVLNKNLILNTDPQGGVSAIASYAEFTSAVSANHIVGYSADSAFWNVSLSDLAEGNKVYADLATYQNEVSANERLGSDIFSLTQPQ